jgi:hypothetical protein
LPADIQQRALDSLRDDDLMSNRKAIALVEARMYELARRLGSGESAFSLQRLQETWDAVTTAKNSVERQSRLADHGLALRQVANSELASRETIEALQESKSSLQRLLGTVGGDRRSRRAILD